MISDEKIENVFYTFNRACKQAITLGLYFSMTRQLLKRRTINMMQPFLHFSSLGPLHQEVLKYGEIKKSFNNFRLENHRDIKINKTVYGLPWICKLLTRLERVYK